MTCPYNSGEKSGRDPKSRNVQRRQFLKAAVAIGGSQALSACLQRENPEEVPAGGSNETPTQRDSNEEQGEDGDVELAPVPGPEPADPSVSQHAWVEYLSRSQKDVPQNPRHHVLLLFDYVGDDIRSDRETVESALKSLEDAYKWSSDGLLFTIGYSAFYFQEYDGKIPKGLEKPEAISALEDPEIDEADVCLHLASDHAHVVLAADQAVRGGISEIEGRIIEADMSSVFDLQDRRTGFVGKGLPAEHQDVEGIPPGNPVPKESPLYMGVHTFHGLQEYHPDYDPDVTKVHNQARESSVTISEGAFEGGTIQQVSQIRLELGEWYGDMTVSERISRMIDPLTGDAIDIVGKRAQHAEEGSRFNAEAIPRLAREHGLTGHADKVARARVEMEPRILRRDFDSTDGGHARLHFVSLQEDIEDFVVTRQKMDGQDLVDQHEDIGEVENNGILEFIDVERRGNYLIPPQSKRSLPITYD